jgi:hypothetical protein
MSTIKSSFDVLSVKQTVLKIQERIQELEKDNPKSVFQLETTILEEFPEFYDDHPHLVKKLCKKDDLSMLYKMLDNLEQVDNGKKSLAGVELKLGNELAEQYLYPVTRKLDAANKLDAKTKDKK